MANPLEDPSIYSDPAKLLTAIGLRVPPELPTEEDIKTKATHYSTLIFQNWNDLNHILKLHEETIRKRWAKKTVKQRETLLRAAYPAIPALHRPDIKALREETLEQRRAGTRFRDAYLLPELNVEDLVKLKNFYLLINARGRNMPDIFAFADFEKIKIARTSEGVPVPFKNECTIYLTGQKNAKSYGKLVYWNEGPNVFGDMANGVGMLPGAGLIVLEIQHKLLDFLVKVTKSMIHDLPLTGNYAPDPPPLEDPLLDLELSSIAAYATSSMYGVPLQFDLRYLKRLAQAKIEQAQDHLWSLREDPSYFRDVAQEYSEHRLEHLRTVDGKRHPNLNTAWLWDQIFLSLIGNAYTSVLRWKLIKVQLEELERLRVKYGSKISTGKELPQEYDDCISYLRWFLEQFITTGPIKDLMIGVAGAPPMRKWFNRLPQDPNSTMIGTQFSSTYCNCPLSERPEVVVLISLLFDRIQSIFMGRYTILDEIDPRLCYPWILDYLSEMSTISEFLRQIEMHQPRVGMNTTYPVDPEYVVPDDPDLSDGQSALFERMIEPVTRILAPMKKRDFRGRGPSLVDPSTSESNTPLRNGKFSYPVHKRATQAVIEQMRRAEGELDAFWAKFDGLIERRTGKKPNDLLKEYIDQREVERTPEWVNIPKPPTHHVETKSALEDRFALMELEQRTESTLGPEPSAVEGSKRGKTKAKTRGQPVPSTELPSSLQQAPSAPDTHPSSSSPLIPVPRRAYTVFARLFFTPSPDRTPGEVAWADFLHAMTTAGCSAKRLMGSSWMFSRSQNGNDTSDESSSSSEDEGTGGGSAQIIFHEPHPAANIPIHIVRKHGRRLARRWGWSIDSFVMG
ncbi:hypothetical protein BDP27DRAFT_1347016 [Rhodocollybia butyracea]|uniref:Uncharacterized protein n=1 Tax=Rhodocollybia butyracea TaxID=206335 RepID=A0A9P5P696_9AGAR|nr:hypothetical protein BDP27DRAFT_1347016 [Rhodocollybia butyracea]